jgi:hypothetical protein
LQYIHRPKECTAGRMELLVNSQWSKKNLKSLPEMEGEEDYFLWRYETTNDNRKALLLSVECSSELSFPMYILRFPACTYFPETNTFQLHI